MIMKSKKLCCLLCIPVLLVSCEDRKGTPSTEDVLINVTYDRSGKMVINSGKRSFYPGIERTVQNTLVRLIPYKGENLVYTRVRNHFSLFVIQRDETLPLLRPLIVNAFGGGDIEGAHLPDLAIYRTRLAGVSNENGIEILVEGTRDYQLVTGSDFWNGIGSGEIDFAEVMKDVIPNGYYTIRLFCDIENGRLVCKKKLCLCEDFNNFPEDVIPFDERSVETGF